ncbi:MAG TPA: hypothetical protein VK735_36920 [Pseudonocardia sp.]|jgi:hypothetical protein|uniref:hypothetical protein n=1 Tax=Pseudonocardia sp. TaxID=60912 RepID=UPI002BC325A3|nr:hypothetical protein [Pseudonocardia sp.]HTF53062.1 hypothetical protein [Pseudonocardia sp.]
MPRHRAPSTQSRALANLTISGALTGAALSASVLSPVAASAATSQGEQLTGRHSHGGHHDRDRPMTSGERQYRNGCRQGYINDDCEQFSVTNLLRRGIDPFL